METFSALLTLCAGNSQVTGEIPSQWPVMRSFDVYFDLCLNKRLSKQSWGWWFEMPSCSLWRQCNGWRGCPCAIQWGWHNPHVPPIYCYTSSILIQSNAVKTQSNVTWYCIHHCRNWGRISISGCTLKSHPISRPDRRAMGCLLWIFFENIDRVITAPHCIQSLSHLIQNPLLEFQMGITNLQLTQIVLDTYMLSYMPYSVTDCFLV